MILVDATTLIALGSVGELNLLWCFDRPLLLQDEVLGEVSTEPANANLTEFLKADEVAVSPAESADPSEDVKETRREAREILGEPAVNGDVQIIANVLRAKRTDEKRVVVSDDRRVRTVARGLGATVTGTVGVVVRSVEEREMTAADGKALVRCIDGRGLHMTGELRDTADELIEDAAKNE